MTNIKMISNSYYAEGQGVNGLTPYQHEFTMSSLTGVFRVDSPFAEEGGSSSAQDLDLGLRQWTDLALEP